MIYLLLALIGVTALYVVTEALWRQYAWGRLLLYVHTQHPIANTRPPTELEIGLYVAEEESR